MADRRYDDEEVAAILRAAMEDSAESPHPAPDERGLTLAEIQAAGQEVGVSRDAIAQAARTIDVRRAAVSRRFLGLPIGVERSVLLDRRLSDDEWERLVVELREVFHARGTMRSEGSLRQWTNGNLYALMEPVGNGYRLRFGSVHGAARIRITAGLAVFGVTLVTALTSILTGSAGEVLPQTLIMMLVGSVLVGGSALQLSRWSQLRGSQMEALAARLAGTTASDNRVQSATELDAGAGR